MNRTSESYSKFSFLSCSSKDTERFAATVASALPTNQFKIYLQGDLGVGKTTFARGLLRGYGVKETICSPTFSLAEIYEVGQLKVCHLDFYRCLQETEWFEAGLSEDLECSDLVIIEWSEKAKGLPNPDIFLFISDTRGLYDRTLELKAVSRQGDRLLRSFTK